jgi:hypothetical protein
MEKGGRTWKAMRDDRRSNCNDRCYDFLHVTSLNTLWTYDKTLEGSSARHVGAGRRKMTFRPGIRLYGGLRPSLSYLMTIVYVYKYIYMQPDLLIII